MKNQKLVRVGTMNNFGFTQAEYSQLNRFVGRFFVNGNIKGVTKITAKNINQSAIPIVITINPDLVINPEYINKLKLIDKKVIAFIRLKFAPGYGHADLYNRLISAGYNVVVTLMRFKSKISFEKFIAPNYRSMYSHNGGYYRLLPDFYPSIFTLICDRKGKGCQACYLCAKLVTGKAQQIYSLNLSSSGTCRYDCPDCFAKSCIKRSGQDHPEFNRIKQNRKQAGKIKQHN